MTADQIKRIDALMARAKIDVLLLHGNTPEHSSFRYLVGGEKLENATLVWRRGGMKLLLAGDMERDNAARTGFRVMAMSTTRYQAIIRKHGNTARGRAAWLVWALKKARARGRVALYGSAGLETGVALIPALKREMKAAGLKLVAEKTPTLSVAREIKTAEELAHIHFAGIGTRAAFDALRRALARCHERGGKLRRSNGEVLHIGDLKSVVNETLARHGLVNVYGSIVAQGEESGVPHNAGSDERPVRARQPIIADIFPRCARSGYFFDMTRTFLPGRATRAQKQAYEDVRQATTIGFEAFEPGISFAELQRRVQIFMEGKGYETLRSHPGTQVGFCHGLGHGVGLDVHENPFARDVSLEPGMILTIEPGVYYPERKLGVRIEDMALVTAAGLENLTEYPCVFEVPLRERP